MANKSILCALKKTVSATCISGLLQLSMGQVYANFEGCRLPEPLPTQICVLIKGKENVIRDKKVTLDHLREIQQIILQGKNIQQKLADERFSELTDDEKLINELALVIENDDQVVEAAQRLDDPLITQEDSAELLVIQDQIDNEIEDVEQSDNTQLKTGIASIGGLIISSIAIGVMSRSTKGQTLKRRLAAQLLPDEKKIFKWTINAMLLVSLAMGFFAAFRMFENNKEKVTLKIMAQILSLIKSQADNIATMEEELDELESCYWLQVDQLVEKGLASESPSGLQCL